MKLLQWIDRQRVDAENLRNERFGRAVMRRLNKTEYTNTIRDLLQVDVSMLQRLGIEVDAFNSGTGPLSGLAMSTT